MDRVSTRAIANIATTAQADRPIQYVFFALLIGINSIEVFELPADSLFARYPDFLYASPPMAARAAFLRKAA